MPPLASSSSTPELNPISRRSFLKQAAAAGATLSLLGSVRGQSRAERRPNVLFLLSDQHNADCASFAGHPDLHTPHLDRLAAEGTRFNRAYCQDGICVPSRNSMLTGQYPRTFGIMRNGERTTVMNDLVPMQRAFKAAGYETFTAGKRHLRPPVDTDWDHAFGHLREEAPRDTLNYWTWIQQQGLRHQMEDDWNAEFGYRLPGNQAAPMACRISELPPAATMEAFTARRTVEFLRAARAADRPFFAWSTFYRPHQPYTPLASYAAQFDQQTVRLPANLTQPISELPPFFQHYRTKRDKPWDLGDAAEHHELYRMYVAYYLALVKEIDDHIGTILQELDTLGLAENTIVVYASDHGDFVGAHGFIEKAAMGHNVYEETLRVPLLFRFPGQICANVRREDLVELVDLYPTLLELCQISPPGGYRLPGRSLVPTLRAGREVGRTFVVSENWSQAAVITPRYKLGRWLDCPFPDGDFRQAGDMVFDREHDRAENRNLAATPEGRVIAADLERHLRAWVATVDDRGRRETFAQRKHPYTVL